MLLGLIKLNEPQDSVHLVFESASRVSLSRAPSPALIKKLCGLIDIEKGEIIRFQETSADVDDKVMTTFRTHSLGKRKTCGTFIWEA